MAPMCGATPRYKSYVHTEHEYQSLPTNETASLPGGIMTPKNVDKHFFTFAASESNELQREALFVVCYIESRQLNIEATTHTISNWTTVCWTHTHTNPRTDIMRIHTH